MGITIEEQVAMFLFTVARSAGNRDVQERFQHSGETVSRYFHDVLKAINRLVPKYIKLPTSSGPNMSIAITSNAKFYPYSLITCRQCLYEILCGGLGDFP